MSSAASGHLFLFSPTGHGHWFYNTFLALTIMFSNKCPVGRPQGLYEMFQCALELASCRVSRSCQKKLPLESKCGYVRF
jgi:hypothetical protein